MVNRFTGLRTKTFLLFAFSFQLSAFCVQAQKFELGLHLGGAGYMGDLNPREYQRYTDPVLGGIFRWNINPRNTVKLSLTTGMVRGDDAKADNAYQTDRNLHFRSTLSEFSVQFEFNFFNYNPLWGNNRFAPYVFTGFSVFHFDPEAREFDGDWVHLRPLGTEGQGQEGMPRRYKQVGSAIPLGLGFKFNLGRNWNLFTEMGYRFTFTDYLDDVSGYYPDAETWSGMPGEAQYFSDQRLHKLPNPPHGLQRGDLGKKDTYHFAVIGISYTFVSSWCPGFSMWGKD